MAEITSQEFDGWSIDAQQKHIKQLAQDAYDNAHPLRAYLDADTNNTIVGYTRELLAKTLEAHPYLTDELDKIYLDKLIFRLVMGWGIDNWK